MEVFGRFAQVQACFQYIIISAFQYDELMGQNYVIRCVIETR